MLLEIKKLPGITMVGKLPLGLERGGFYLNLEKMLFITFDAHAINFYTDAQVFHVYFEQEAMKEFERLKKLIMEHCVK